MKRIRSGIFGVAALAVATSGCAGARMQSGPSEPEVLFRFRMAYETQAPGTQRMERYGSDAVYFVADEDVISDEHIAAARTIETPTGLNVVMRLTEEGASRMRETTGSHLGDRLAIFVGERLISAPVILSEVGSSTTPQMLGVNLSAEEARSLAADIATRFEGMD